MRLRSILFHTQSLLALGALAVCAATSHAATFTWDASGGAPLDDGPGAWNASGGTNWTTDGASFDAWGNTTGDEAVFGANNGAAGTVNVGTVDANSITFNPPGSDAYTLSGGTITLGGTTPTITTNANAAIGSVVAGSGVSFTKSGGATLTLTGTSTYTGATSVSEGTLIIAPTVNVGNNGTLTQSSSDYSVADGATLRFDASALQGGTAFAIWKIKPVSVSAGGTLELHTTSTIHNNVGANALLLYWGGSDEISGLGSLNKTGAGVFVINGTGTLNNFAGTLNVNEGTLGLQGGPTSAVGNFAVNIASGATLDIRTDSHMVGTLSGSGQITKSSTVNGTSTLTIGNDNGTETYSGTIANPTGVIALVKAGTGTQTLDGSVSFTGGATINGGMLVIDGTSTGSAFTVNSGGTLGGAGTIGGAVTVNSGGMIAPGSGTGPSIETLTLNNNLTLNAGSTTICEIVKTEGVPSNDQILVSGVNFGGTLEVIASGEALAADDEFLLFDALSYSGTFSTVTLPMLPAGLVWDQADLLTTGMIRVSNRADTPAFSPGDGNYLAPQTITMTSGSGSTVYYTFASGGSEPPNPTTGSASGTPGAGTATLTLHTTGVWKVKAMATKSGLGNSAIALGTFNLIPTPVWINTAGGFWSDLPEDESNWQNNLVAEGSGIPADFSTLTLPADAIVTLDADRTIGSLLFGDLGGQFNWTLDGTSTLTLAGPAPTIAVNNGSATVSTPLAGASGLVKTGAGDLVLSGGGGLTGGTAINAGTLTFRMPFNANWTVNGGAKTIASGATMRVDMSPQTTQYLTTSIGATTINAGATLELYGTNTNAATFYVLEANTWTPSGGGTVKVTGGASVAVKTADYSNFTGTIEVENGQFANNSPNTSASNVFNVNVATGSKLDMRADGITFNALNGSGSVIKSFNGFTGVLTVGNGDGDGDFSGPMSAPANSYSLVKTGTGTQILSGDLTYGGATTVNGGTLVINGTSANSAFSVASGATLAGTGSISGALTVDSGGTIAPGQSVGTLILGPVVNLNTGSTYAVEITGAATHDKIVSSGTINANGTIKVTTTGFTPAEGASFEVVDGAITGTPSFDFSAAPLPDGLAWDTSQFAASGVIKVIEGSNYTTWAEGNGASGQSMDQDHDNDGVPNGVEYFMGETGSGFTAMQGITPGRMAAWTKGGSYTGTYGTDYWVETSFTLAADSWTKVAADDPNLVKDAVAYTLPLDGAKKFARLVVVGP